MKEQTFYGLTKEQVETLNNYFLEKPAKEAIPYLQIIQKLPQITVKIEEKVDDPAQLPLPLAIENEPGGEDVPETVIAPV
jgi:hypothetical protein